MVTNCTPLLANLFLNSHEVQFIQKLVHVRSKILAVAYLTLYSVSMNWDYVSHEPSWNNNFTFKNSLISLANSQHSVSTTFPFISGLIHYEVLKSQTKHPTFARFFVHNDTAPLTRFKFNLVLQKATKHSGKSDYVGTHSFRIGRATDMALQGVPYNDIQKAGRWRSPDFSNYIRIA